MSFSGRLKTMELPDVLQWVALGRKTGTLSFVRDNTKVYLFLKDGRIISSRSSDPAKQIGQFLLFRGKITEPQLKKAFEIHLQSKIILGKILVQENLVSQEDVEAAQRERTEEVIYDLFLWEDGHFRFDAGEYNLDDLILIKIDINNLIFEGVRRKDEWGRIRSVFPHGNMVLSLRPGTNLKTLSLTSLQKKLLYLVTLKKPITEIISECYGSDFDVHFELFQLYEQNIIDISDVLSPPVEEIDPIKLFSRGLELMKGRKYREAIATFQEVLKLDPQNMWASEQIEQADIALWQECPQSAIPTRNGKY
jgi:tetratricopeptide (TPR) repeat protein